MFTNYPMWFKGNLHMSYHLILTTKLEADISVPILQMEN